MAGDEALPVPGHDEERVVDPDTETDQKHEGGGELGHLHDMTEKSDQTDRSAQRRQGRDEGEGHGEQGPEDEQQNDGGEQDPDARPAERRPDGFLGQLTRDGDVQSGAVGRGGGVHEVFGDGGRQVLGLLVEGHSGEGHRVVPAHTGGALGSVG
jgi:hypothetical protein